MTEARDVLEELDAARGALNLAVQQRDRMREERDTAREERDVARELSCRYMERLEAIRELVHG